MGRWGRDKISLERGGACLLGPHTRPIGEENEIFQPAISAANSITAGACTKSCNFPGPEIEKS